MSTWCVLFSVLLVCVHVYVCSLRELILGAISYEDVLFIDVSDTWTKLTSKTACEIHHHCDDQIDEIELLSLTDTIEIALCIGISIFFFLPVISWVTRVTLSIARRHSKRTDERVRNHFFNLSVIIQLLQLCTVLDKSSAILVLFTSFSFCLCSDKVNYGYTDAWIIHSWNDFLFNFIQLNKDCSVL